MDSEEAARQLANVINRIEAAGVELDLPSSVRVGSARVTVGKYDGDPWTVDTAG